MNNILERRHSKFENETQINFFDQRFLTEPRISLKNPNIHSSLVNNTLNNKRKDFPFSLNNKPNNSLIKNKHTIVFTK